MQEDGETLYLCDGVLYRATYYQDEQVFEIVSDAEEEAAAEPTSVIGLGLTSPMTRGQVVRDLQNQLVELGYEVGSVDGVFGAATEAAILWVQYDNGLEQTGFVDRATAEVLGFDVPAAPPPAGESDGGATAATTEEATQAEDDPAMPGATGDAVTDTPAETGTAEETTGEDSGAETGSGSD